jgi:hypothetical protein
MHAGLQGVCDCSLCAACKWEKSSLGPVARRAGAAGFLIRIDKAVGATGFPADCNEPDLLSHGVVAAPVSGSAHQVTCGLAVAWSTMCNLHWAGEVPTGRGVLAELGRQRLQVVNLHTENWTEAVTCGFCAWWVVR